MLLHQPGQRTECQSCHSRRTRSQGKAQRPDRVADPVFVGISLGRILSNYQDRRYAFSPEGCFVPSVTFLSYNFARWDLV
jgi:hypothetical protein